MDVGVRIKELRLRRGWSQKDLADNAGVSSSYVQRLEGGDYTIRGPSRVFLEKLARALGVSVAVLEEPSNGNAGSEEHALSAADPNRYKASLYERFAERYNAGDPEQFLERVAGLPFREQEFIDRLARLLELEQHLG